MVITICIHICLLLLFIVNVCAYYIHLDIKRIKTILLYSFEYSYPSHAKQSSLIALAAISPRKTDSVLV